MYGTGKYGLTIWKAGVESLSTHIWNQLVDLGEYALIQHPNNSVIFDAVISPLVSHIVFLHAIPKASMLVLRQLILRGIAVPSTILARRPQWDLDQFRYYDTSLTASSSSSTLPSGGSITAGGISGRIVNCASVADVPESRRPSQSLSSWSRPSTPSLPEDLSRCRAVVQLLCVTYPVADINSQPGLPDMNVVFLSDAKLLGDICVDHPAMGFESPLDDGEYVDTKSYQLRSRVSRERLSRLHDQRMSSSPILFDEFQHGRARFDRINMLLEMKADPNVVTYTGNSSLTSVLTTTPNKDQLPLIQLLIRAGANPSHRGLIRPRMYSYRTPLSIAIDKYKVDIAIYLMENDANVADAVTALDGLDNRAVEWVRQTNNAKLLEALCERGLQISESARHKLRQSVPANGLDVSDALQGIFTRVCEVAIERGQAKFQRAVDTICGVAIDVVRMPRVLAYIIAEYSIYFIPSVEQVEEAKREHQTLTLSWRLLREHQSSTTPTLPTTTPLHH